MSGAYIEVPTLRDSHEVVSWGFQDLWYVWELFRDYGSPFYGNLWGLSQITYSETDMDP